MYFVRDGEAHADTTQKDPPLTKQGRDQAARLRGHPAFKSLEQPLFVVVSPLRRALETATIAFDFSEGATIRANLDLQMHTTYPGDMRTSQAKLKKDFPRVHFMGLEEARVQGEAPDWRRFVTWCTEAGAETVIAVTHGSVCYSILGVHLTHGDSLGACLSRQTLRWSPLTFPKPARKTLEDTVAYGTPFGREKGLGRTWKALVWGKRPRGFFLSVV